MNTWMEQSRRAGGTGRGRILATLSVAVLASAVAIVLSLLLGSASALAAGQEPGTEHAGFQRGGTLRVEFTDRAGRPTEGALVSVRGAVPGMVPISTSITVSNTGTLPAAYTVSTANLLRTESVSLDDVLKVIVRTDDGERLYRGKLSGLAFGEDHLEPGEARTYELSISWPSTSNDNDYQGLPLTFGLRTDATAASR